MGAPDDEPDRQSWDGPPTKVTIPKPFALAKYEVTRGQFAKFAAATQRSIGANCRTFNGTWYADPAADYRKANFPQTDKHPVVCVVLLRRYFLKTTSPLFISQFQAQI